MDVFSQELQSMLWLSQQGDTFAEFYELNGNFPNERSRQLWSDTGFLSMIFHGLFGMQFLPDGIAFAPLKPDSLFAETISLRGVRYRKMVLNIEVSGSGSQVAEFYVDGRRQQEPFIKCDLTGTHSVAISVVETAADYMSEAFNQYPDDSEKSSWVLYGAFGALFLILLFAGRRSLRRFLRKKFGDAHKK